MLNTESITCLEVEIGSERANRSRGKKDAY